MLRNGFLLLLLGLSSMLTAQNDSLRTFDLNLEFRPRFEFRDGYRTLPSANTSPAFFVSQRSRLSLNYKQRKTSFHFSFQDVRIWGQNGNSPAVGGLGIFESYALFELNNRFSLKIGRQAVELDNGRLFSKANWNQFSRTHDGLNLIYKNKKINSHLFFFYNQSGSAIFGTNYNPPSAFYKYMATHFLTWKIKPTISINVLNVLDGFQSPNNPNIVYARGTSGGAFFYKGKAFFATLRAYYQYGQTRSQEKLSSYFLQPELGVKIKKHSFRLGMEYISGNSEVNASFYSTTFDILYGVAFKFNGNLNYFTNFANDTRGKGLVNPYISLDLQLSKKFRFKSQFHVFLTEKTLRNQFNQPVSPFLGVENDLKIKYSIRDDLSLDAGLSLMIASKSMELLKNGNSNQIPVFSFLMLTWKPTLFQWEQEYPTLKK